LLLAETEYQHSYAGELGGGNGSMLQREVKQFMENVEVVNQCGFFL